MFQGSFCTPLIPFPELYWNHVWLTTAKPRLLKHTCQSSCSNSLQTRTSWKLTWLHPPTKESTLPSALPKHPWEKVASDLFEFKVKQYLLVVDYVLLTLCGSYSTYCNHLFQCDILHKKHLLETWNPSYYGERQCLPVQLCRDEGLRILIWV